ncbi:limonene-1,2-epoxide hydrolase [Parasphingorhabdus marina DSM 22363]|uniref:Limonene-1,2-epoxide hydrolase n=1 Tax=Parasphingorhabdus marina DSM 22363 TaxID=1123272 RepID=A0A1N6CW63_9SPHN|nr:limonene-1,2-epoxide hydrolase family protein [Parasphingorhabdus marina]SIN62634.1 limonene-1,2-epoxide hydrolase [Parasphingorhabdus marina DSM 22363]
MTDSKQLVLDFIDAWNRLDYDAIYAAMADDIFYHNIPMEPCEGIGAVRAFFDGSGMGSDGAEWIVHHIAADGDTVLTERTDKFRINGEWIAIRVMGTFEMENGKIAKWRDYFDLAEFQNEMARVMGAASA